MPRARILGFEWDASSSHARGPALGPSIVKRLLTSEASSGYSADLTDMREAIAGYDIPALPEDGASARAMIERTVAETLARGEAPLSIGGDHSITFPILKAVAAKYGAVNILHIDAHGDLHDDYEGDKFSHACPFARAHEAGLVARHVAVGIRCWDPHQKTQAEKYGVTILPAHALDHIPDTLFEAPLYMSIDLDGLDPAFAPGVSHPEPGGLSTLDVLALIRRIKGPLIGADIVELNPERDPMLATARVAVRLAKELAAKMTAS
ncbi:MAG: arginase family protein [Parvularculaceae bacterium]|nr:arginase family protein [Parvularculaceae bacterium]